MARPLLLAGGMFQYALIFFVIALIAALMGFGGVAGMSADVGRLFLIVGVVVLIAGLLGRVLTGRNPSSLP